MDQRGAEEIVIDDARWLHRATMTDRSMRVVCTIQLRTPQEANLEAIDEVLIESCWTELVTRFTQPEDMLLQKAWETEISLHPECDDPGCGRFHRSHTYGEGVQWPSLDTVLSRLACRQVTP
ncbi:hypothetical protein AD006_12330 [Pseudonocardia sp. EC080610-09]|nr:hypothetical protein FRP1_04670 [Pseudonocardia sp. EC080625-04]ALL75893.1 hypothetical protein AD006_12330 [Pseudonocardia sp. EC080610-09]ALL82920.1 hypothetical protein AD017_20155 [Pseudonocardia sp. EC080619-01]